MAALLLLLAAALIALPAEAAAHAPTQVILQFTQPPAAHLVPSGARLAGASQQRLAAVHAAAAAAKAEHDAFRVAAAGAGFCQEHAYKHVSLQHLRCTTFKSLQKPAHGHARLMIDLHAPSLELYSDDGEGPVFAARCTAALLGSAIRAGTRGFAR